MYQNYGYQYNRQPYYQPVQQVQQQGDMAFNDVRFLTEEQIKAFIVMPNTRVLLIDRQNKVASIESCDNLGNLSVQRFSFESLDKPVQEVDYNQFATKKDFESLNEQIKALQDKLKSEVKGNGKNEQLASNNNIKI